MKSSFPEDNNTTVESQYHTLHTLVPNSIRFTLLLIFEIPSIICYLFVIGYILSKQSLRSAPNNNVMLIILFLSFFIVTFDIPSEIEYYRRNTMPIKSSTFCMIWWFVDISFFYLCQMLVAWASFERHILIFHGYLLKEKWKKICFHYTPPLILIICMWTFYSYTIFLFPCESYIDFENLRCAVPCYLDDPVLGFWDSIFHGIFATLCIIIFSCALLIRVYRSKSRLQLTMNWRKYRKMLFQLISISSLYLSINLPFFIIYIMYMTSFFDWTSTALECLGFFSYFIPLLLPFICLASIPKIGTKLKRIIHFRTNRRIEPIPLRVLTRNSHHGSAQA